MEFEQGWLTKQIDLANNEINKWSDGKKRIMLREDYDDFMLRGEKGETAPEHAKKASADSK